ncbi:MAG: hypothetical protein V3W28_06550 [Thermoplasmata archaeon]
MTAIDRCRACGNGIIKWRPNRKLCRPCALKSLRESKRLWQAQYRARMREVHARSEESQRRDAAYDEDYGHIVGREG